MEFRILGPLEVADAGRTLALPGGKPRTLLAVLLLHANQVVPLERLIDDLWDEEPPETAINTLQVYVSQLRRALCPGDARRARDLVGTRAPGYVLRLEPDELDLERFERHVAAARTALAQDEPAQAAAIFTDALSLWRGPPLAELANERFAQPEIARLEEARLAALEDRFDAELQLGRHAGLISELEALVAEEPLRERPRRQLMLALYRSGRHAEALELYQRTRRELIEELGLEPSSALQQLHRAILVQDASLDQAVAAETPPPPEAAAVETRQVRKTVTILIADVAAGSSVDPETQRSQLDRFFDAATAVVARCGGSAERLPGDALLGAFGIPRLHEDDALRAVQAALELRRLTQGNQTGRGLDVRLGVDTGELLTHEPSSSALDLGGGAVNRSVRLARAANPGEILIAESTRRLIADAVQVNQVESARAPGEAWTLDRLVLGAPGFRRRLENVLVGREEELGLLRQAFDRCVRERRAYLATVFGPAGIGKSRLARELALSLDEQARVLIGRCLSYGTGITFWPLAEILRQLGGEQGSAAIARLLGGGDDAELTASRLAAAAGLETGPLEADEVAPSTRKLFAALARERPLVVVLDDVHWAEPTFLDLIEHIRDWTHDAPITLLCLARPELLEARPAWGIARSNATSLFLPPLSETDANTLIERTAGGRALRDEERTRISDAAEGNPLFIEQMLAMLLESEPSRRPASVPPTIQALLAARLDQLDWQERTLLEIASVMGTTFSVAAVESLAPESVGAEIRLRLQALLDKGLLRAGPAEFGDDEAMRFHHALIRDVAYESITKERRAELHERIGDWLEAQAGESGAAFEILGYHFEQAHRYRVELGASGRRTLAAKGGRYLARAGQRSYAAGDAAVAQSLFTRAAALLPAGDRSRLELLPDLADALRDTGDFHRAQAVVQEIVAQARASGDEAAVSHALVVNARVQLQVNPEITTDEVLVNVERAIQRFEELGDARGLARAWETLAWVPWVRGQAAAAEAALQHAIEHAGSAGDARREAQALHLLLGAALFGPLPIVEGIRRCHEVLEHHGTKRRIVASAFRALGVLRGMQGSFEEARDFLARDREILRDLGLTVVLAISAEAAAMVELLAGEPAAAERELRHAYRTLEEHGETSALSTLAALLARALSVQGADDEALELSKVSERVAGSDDASTNIQWRGVRATILARQGRIKTAERLARGAVELGSNSDFLNLHGDALLDLGEVLHLGQRQTEARAAVEQALRLFETKGNLVSSARTRVRLKALGGQAKPGAMKIAG